jgi:hypothetical protein
MYIGLILPEDKMRIKEIMRNLYVNGHVLTRNQLREYKHEFRKFTWKYKGITEEQFKQIYITK